MVLLGLILMLLGVGLGAAAVLASRDATGTVALSVWGFTRDAHPLELILLGIAAMLLFALGWAAVSASARRRARIRRDEREADRIATAESAAESARLEHERRLEEAGLRDEDLRGREEHLTRREEDLRAWSDELDARERELSRAEADARRDRGPTVADVVTGRAQGNVAAGTARWGDEPAPTQQDLPQN